MNTTTPAEVQLGSRDFVVVILALVSSFGSVLLGIWKATRASQLKCCGHRCIDYSVTREDHDAQVSDNEERRLRRAMEFAVAMMERNNNGPSPHSSPPRRGDSDSE